MTFTERLDRFNRLATELARSGRFKNYEGVTLELRLEHDYPMAHAWLDSHGARARIDHLCDLARKANDTEGR